MDAQEFYRLVQERAGLPSQADAVRATEETLFSLKQVLPQDVLWSMRSQVPPEVGAFLDGGPVEPDPLVDWEVFVGPLVNMLDTEAAADDTLGGLDLVSVYAGEDAVRRIQAVFSALKGVIDEPTAAGIEAALPGEVAGWFREA
ncbi:MAG: DUF2267 domain-containing protein [Firmicutes bacterium]|nr:DUF2267 domain-containing protein [Bacillota bacterium]